MCSACLADIDPGSTRYHEVTNRHRDSVTRKDSKCPTCEYPIKGDQASHETGFVHIDNLSRLKDGKDLIGKAWHCEYCGESMFRGRVDHHVKTHWHLRCVEKGNTFMQPCLQSRLISMQGNFLQTNTTAPGVALNVWTSTISTHIDAFSVLHDARCLTNPLLHVWSYARLRPIAALTFESKF